MSRNVVILAAVGLLGVLAGAASEAATKAKTRKTPAPQAASFANDVEKLAKAVGLTEEQRTKIQQLKAERDAALAKWDQTNQKRMDAIEAKLGALKGKKDARARATLQRQLSAFRSGRARLAANHDRGMFAVLTRDQRGKLNGPVLAEAVFKEYARLKLDDAQKQKVRQLCHSRGGGILEPADPKRHEVAFKAVKQQAYASILTPEQRREVAKRRQPAKSRARTSRTTSRKRTSRK